MDTAADNARSANRLSPTSDSAVVHGLLPTPVPAAVIDESFSGIGIAVPLKLATPGNAANLEGRELTIEYGGVSCVAVIRHVAPLESGCRLGMEWKAQALSRCLRDLVVLQPDIGEELGRTLPSGMSMMWKLFESNRWLLLLDSTHRLHRQVASCGITDLIQPIEEFYELIQDIGEPGKETNSETKSKVEAALEELIRKCIAALS